MWNWFGRGRIGDVETSVVGGVNAERVKCKEDGGTVCDFWKWSLYILLISCDRGHMDNKLDLKEFL